MKTYLILSSLFILIFQMLLFGQNIVQNGGFENDFAYWQTTGIANISQNTVHSGNKSFESASSISQYAYIYQKLNVKATSFDAIFWVYPGSETYFNTFELIANWDDFISDIIFRIEFAQDSMKINVLDNDTTVANVLNPTAWNKIAIHANDASLTTSLFINDDYVCSLSSSSSIPAEWILLGDLSDNKHYGVFYYDDISFVPNVREGLVAHYPFEGDARDMSGYGNNGIVYGAALTNDRFDSANGAYAFDGLDDFIVVKDDDILSPANNKLTIAMWAKTNYPGNKYFLYKGNYHYDREYSMGLRSDSLFSFAINNLGGWENDQYGVPSITIAEQGIWYHIVGTWNGTYQKIYVNGKLENTAAPPVVIGNYNSDLYIGSYGGDISEYAINATIDDIRIYNKALSAEEVCDLYAGSLLADFSANKTIGVPPITVQFSDQSRATDSLLAIDSWKWDFNNDGEIDSEEQNPEWTYNESGIYTVKLTVSDSLNEATAVKNNYIAVLSENPLILSVNDVPEDQGGWVKVNFYRSSYDTDSLSLPKAMSAELYTIEIKDGEEWTAAATTVAYGKNLYSVLVPTAGNLTSESNGLMKFRVVAGMEEGNFVSNVMEGYSVDNLHPASPDGLSAAMRDANHVEIIWNEIGDSDFDHFNIYRNTENSFDDHSQPISQTTGTIYTDTQVEPGKMYYYTIKSVDFSGNESDFSEAASIQITSTSDKKEKKAIPKSFYINQNYPNPFNPTTFISYGLPEDAYVKITIYNIRGQEILHIVNRQQYAGKYNIAWNGFDHSGNQMASGLYLYEMHAGNYREIHKMILMR